MTNWYASHLILYVQLKDRTQRKFPIWENIILIKAKTEEEAFAKAERRGKDEEGDDNGSFRWEGKPARWVFAGIRKLTLCEDPERRPDDGTEVSYTEMEVDSEQAVAKLVGGQSVSVTFADAFVEAER
jgi:hypothetical protein